MEVESSREGMGLGAKSTRVKVGAKRFATWGEVYDLVVAGRIIKQVSRCLLATDAAHEQSVGRACYLPRGLNLVMASQLAQACGLLFDSSVQGLVGKQPFVGWSCGLTA